MFREGGAPNEEERNLANQEGVKNDIVRLIDSIEDDATGDRLPLVIETINDLYGQGKREPRDRNGLEDSFVVESSGIKIEVRRYKDGKMFASKFE